MKFCLSKEMGIFLLILWLPVVASLKIGISLSQTGFLRNQIGFLEELPAYAQEAYINQTDDGQLQEWPCFWCQRVVETLTIWKRRAQDLNLEFDIRDDGGNFSRALENYRAMTVDNSIDLLLGPCVGPWNAYIANVVTESKAILTWASIYSIYLGGYRTETCPYCTKKWFRETDWVDSQSYGNQTNFRFGRRDVSIPSGNWTVSNQALHYDWTQNSYAHVYQNAIAALWSIKQVLEAEVKEGNSTWVFAYFGDSTEWSSFTCPWYKDMVESWGNATATLITLQVDGLIWNPLTVDIISTDALVLCGTSSLLGEFLIQASAVHLQFKALFIDLPAGVGKIFGYGSFLVNYLVEPLSISAVLPNVTDAVFGTIDDFAAELQDVPDVASLQVASVVSMLTQAIRQAGSFSNALIPLLKEPNFDTLLGRHMQPHAAFRQFLPSNALALTNYSLKLVPGPLNSNSILVSKAIAELCQGGQYNSSVMCQGPVLDQIAYPMPFSQELFQEAYLCPEGTSLTSLQCRPCESGSFRQTGMHHCQACSTGTYVNFLGAASCLPCPPDSLTCNPSETPRLTAGHFTFTGDWAFLSNNTGFPAIPEFVFGFQGTYNTSTMPTVVSIVKASGLVHCSEKCYLFNDCIAFSYVSVTNDCIMMKEDVLQLPQINSSGTLHYWRQAMLEQLNLSSLQPSVSGQFPVTAFGLEYGKCFVPTPCVGDTTCTEMNQGLFCARCLESHSYDSLFPASRMCAKCPSAVLMNIRILVILVLMILIVAAIQKAAKSVARGSLSLTVPALKMLYQYCIIVVMILDMNFFLVSGIHGMLVRLPLEFLLRPWLLIQVECLPSIISLPAPSNIEANGWAIHIQQELSLYFMLAICILVISESLVGILRRLIGFCFVKLPDFHEDSLKDLQASKPSKESGATGAASSPANSPKHDSKRSLPHMMDAKSDASRWTASEATSHVETIATTAASLTPLSYRKILLRFYWMHLEFELRGKVRTLVRRFSVIIFFVLPIYLRALVIPWRCRQIGSSGNMIDVEYLGVFCDSETAIQLRYGERFTAIIIAMPVTLFLLILATSRTSASMPTLEVLAFITAGLKDGKRWWCIMMEIRLMLIFFLMTVLEGSQLRNLLLLALTASYCLIEIRVSPWTISHNLIMNKSSLALNLSLLLLCVLGAWLEGMTALSDRIQNVVGIFLLVPTILCSVYGCVMLILSLASEVFFAQMLALLKAGAIIGPWTTVVFYVNNWLCGNLFEMHLMKIGGRSALDHSQLNTFERTHLLSMLVELIQGSLARHGKFRMRMVETMLLIAFERAMQVRRGLVNANFHEHGHTLHSLTPIGFPKVLSPDPDLAPLMELKVTLAELQDALQTLMDDIHSGDPEIIYRSTHFSDAKAEDKKSVDHRSKLKTQVMVWDEQRQWQEIEPKVLHGHGDLFAEEAKDREVDLVPQMLNETPAELLRRLTKILENQLTKYQSQVEVLAKDFKEDMVQVLGQKRLADAEERKVRLEVAEHTLNQYANVDLTSLPEGDDRDEKVSSAVQAVKRATSAAKDFLVKVKEWEKSSDSYFTKVFEMLPKVCEGVELKGKKQWEKEFRDARNACLHSYEKMERAVEACQKYPLSGKKE